MVEVNDKAIRDLMLNMYPQKNQKIISNFGTEVTVQSNEQDFESEPQTLNHRQVPPKTQIGLYNDTFVHPVIKRDQTQMTLNIKKWLFSLMISMFSVFLFSGFFLSFIDDVCMKKEIYFFDANGSPKSTLLIILFVILICFSRILFEFDK